MIRIAIAAAFGFLALPWEPAAAEKWDACGVVERYPGRNWGPADASRSGWDETRLLLARQQFEMLESASVVIVHRGRLIADWGDSSERLTSQSVRKGLLNSLVGALARKGALSLDDTLADLGVDDSDPSLTPTERTATLRDLLRSRSGIYHSALYEVGGWKETRERLAQDKAARPERHAPGAFWVYNNWDFNALGSIVEAAAGSPIGEYFRQVIASRIGMQDFRPEDVEYTTKDDIAEKHFGNVSDHRSYVFNISTRDLARYGLLYLGCGEWRGRRVVDREWILQSLDGIDTRLGREPGERETGFGDYGFLWQIDRPGSRRYVGLNTREPAYFATGARGHLLAVIPYLDLVIAHQVGTRGGVSADAQMFRARYGSPEVTDQEMESLLLAIVAAHPQGGNAFLDPAK